MTASLLRWARGGRAMLLLACLAHAGDGLAQSVAQSGAAKGRTHTVLIEGLQFSPAILEAKVGDTVLWVNKDPFPHTATAAGSFDSRSIGAGRSWRFKLKARGSFDYLCTLHPGMKARLLVR